MARPIPEATLIFTRRTRRLYLSWWITHYVVGLTGVIAGTLLTAATSSSPSTGGLTLVKEYSWLIGIVAAVSTSLVTFLGPIHKAERYWSAYHILDQAGLEYSEGEIGLRRFLTRVNQARRILQAIGGDDQAASAAVHEIQTAREPQVE